MTHILVIGAAHLDVVATIDDPALTGANIPGFVSYAIGGCAYNVAANLAFHGVRVELVTCINPETLIGHLVERRLEAGGIGTRWIHRADRAPEGGYVAHFHGIHLHRAVTAVNVENIAWPDGTIAAALAEAALVVIDTNLDAVQIARLAGAARARGIAVFINGVSENKVGRIAEAGAAAGQSGAAFALVTLNLAEARRLVDDFACSELAPAQRLLDVLRADAAVVTEGPRGYCVALRENDGVRLMHKDAPAVDAVVSELGAGDALLAAVASDFVTHGEIDWDRCSGTIARFVVPILKEKSATRDATVFPRSR